MLEYKGYHASAAFSYEDDLYIGSIKGINDTIAFHGNSISELERIFHQAVDNYLSMCVEFKKQPDISNTTCPHS